MPQLKARGLKAMKKVLLSFPIAAAFLIAGASAQAADLPMRPYEVPPPVVVQHIYNWTGIYVGINGGGGWGTQDPLNIITDRFDRFSHGISGGVFGGTLGAQIQMAHVVMGLEADLDWASITGSSVTTVTQGGTF